MTRRQIVGPLRFLAVLLSFLATTVACAQQTSAAPGVQRLLILSKADRVLSIVDPATLKILARVPAGPDPHEVVASTDGTRAYISNYGGGAYNTLTVVDLVNQKSLGTVDLGALRGPHGLHFVGGKVWFTAEPAKAVGS
jgi:DNA-binding beta-propeller fold protein YncE